MNIQDFEKYQQFTEKTIFELSSQITSLEKKLDVFTSLLEISKYINQNIKSKNLFPFINDMLIGVFGAKYSTIYIKMSHDYLKVTPRNFVSPFSHLEKELIMNYKEKEFIINSEIPIYACEAEHEAVYSCLGVPITIDQNTLGYILIQHQEKKYFSKTHATFLSSLANHIGVAIENNLLYNQIKESACKDGLTGLANKSYFFETLDELSNLEHLDYAIVMIDIDNFKQVNDTYGHLYGDIVLQAMTNIIKNNIRPDDLVARYGGEEIIIFFKNFTNKQLMFKRLDLIRQEIQDTVITQDHISCSITASFGAYIKYQETLSLREVIQKADDSLYLCKRSGKNKVMIHD